MLSGKRLMDVRVWYLGNRGSARHAPVEANERLSSATKPWRGTSSVIYAGATFSPRAVARPAVSGAELSRLSQQDDRGARYTCLIRMHELPSHRAALKVDTWALRVSLSRNWMRENETPARLEEDTARNPAGYLRHFNSMSWLFASPAFRRSTQIYFHDFITMWNDRWWNLYYSFN